MYRCEGISSKKLLLKTMIFKNSKERDRIAQKNDVAGI
jgi:hypothetical protein